MNSDLPVCNPRF